MNRGQHVLPLYLARQDETRLLTVYPHQAWLLGSIYQASMWKKKIENADAWLNPDEYEVEIVEIEPE